MSNRSARHRATVPASITFPNVASVRPGRHNTDVSVWSDSSASACVARRTGNVNVAGGWTSSLWRIFMLSARSRLSRSKSSGLHTSADFRCAYRHRHWVRTSCPLNSFSTRLPAGRSHDFRYSGGLSPAYSHTLSHVCRRTSKTNHYPRATPANM